MCTKKVISVILAVLMLFVSLSSLTAFAEEKYPPLESGVYGYIDENKYPIKKNENHRVVKELDPALELQIKQDYIALNPYNGKGEEATTDDVVVKYYGTLSDGSMLVFPYTTYSVWFTEVTYHVIGKYIYTVSELGKDAKIYKNHQFYGIVDSYIEGNLSDDLLDEIADILCFGEFVNPNETKPLATPDTPGEAENKNPQNNNLNNANGAVPTGQNNPLFAVCILLTLSICGAVFAVKLRAVKKEF